MKMSTESHTELRWDDTDPYLQDENTIDPASIAELGLGLIDVSPWDPASTDVDDHRYVSQWMAARHYL